MEAERAGDDIDSLCDRFEKTYVPTLHASTQRDYKGAIAAYIRPSCGRMKIKDVRHADIEKLHRRIAERAPYRANRCVAMLSKMFNTAIKWELRTDNPCRGISKIPENKRERYLTADETERLIAALDAYDRSPSSADAIRLILLTGCRRGEALGAAWAQFDLTTGVWTKPATLTKQKRLHRVPLSKPALELLKRMQAERHDYNKKLVANGYKPAPDFLFLGDNPSEHVVAIKRAWSSICMKAGINGLRVHDLRHSFASVLASKGLSLPVIGALLGHTQIATTQRYSHLLDSALREATELAGAAITGAANSPAKRRPARKTLKKRASQTCEKINPSR